MRHLLLSLILALFTLSVAAQQTTDTPRRGEGISAFLQRNHRPGKAYYREFLRLNEKKLKGKKELMLGVRYVIPPLRGEGGQKNSAKKRRIKEPLFGKKLAQVDVTGSSLAHEDEYAYDVALRLARNLMQEGAEVHIIIQDKKDGIRNENYLKNSKRETCMGDPIPLNQVERLKQRCVKINELYRSDRKKYKYCRSVFLHVDSRSKRAQTDVFFYHAPGSKYGEQLARGMKNTFERKYDRHQPNRGFEGTVSSRNLYVLLNSTPPALFVELGNIQNSFDQRRFVISDNRQALANWMREGLIADYKKCK